MLKRIMCFALCIVTVVSLFAIPVSADVGDNTLYESEPNNYTSTADRIYNDYTIYGSAGQYDLDYYKFVLSSTATVNLICVSSYSTLYVCINDSSDDILYAYQPTTWSSSNQVYSLTKSVRLSAGTYYICVLSSTEVSYSKSYGLYFEYTSTSHTHSYSNACDPTCNTCGYTRTVSHSYSNVCDATCNTCEQTRTAPHAYDNACDDTCNGCGATRAVPGHTYSNDTCDEYCNECEAHRTVPHAYSSVCDTVCDVCDSTRTAPHAYDNACDDSCGECGAIRTAPHAYDNVCDDTCGECGQTRIAPHAYANACDDSCDDCGATRAVPDHTYDNDCDATCNECGATRAVSDHIYDNDCDATCNVCGTTRTITHDYTKKTTVKATTSKNGYILTECSVCGKDKSKTTIYYAKTFKLSATSYTYNGKEKTPTVTVKDAKGNTLKKNTDYTVTYASGRKNVGTYKVTIKMKGKYSGSKTLTFTVKPTSKTSDTLLIGETAKISAKSNTSIKYTSSNKSVATVSSKGVITAKKAGTTTIYVKSGSITHKITVTVKTPYVKVSGTNSVVLKKSVTLKATTNTGAKVKWSSSNTKVATVSSSGKVIGQKAGTATIYAKITYKGKTYTGKFKITVKKPYLTATTATVRIGQTYKISVQGGSGKISYSTSNKSVATVSSSGVIKGLKKGSCTITVKRNGYSMSLKVTVKDYSNIVLYEDSTVKITFKGAEKSKYDNDRVELYFYVKNKKSRTLLIQADAVSLNGYSFCDLTMSDPVSAYSTGIVNLSVNDFDFNLVNLNSINSIGGQFNIIDDATWKSYDAVFANVRLDGKGVSKRPSFSSKNLLYSDSQCAIYFKSVKKNTYFDDRVEMYFYVENKTNKTLLIQADAISINGYSLSDLIMSDPVLPQSIGIVNLSIDDFDFSLINIKKIRTLGGQFRIIDDATWKSYDAIFTNVKLK